MFSIPLIRGGHPYETIERQPVLSYHGETIAEVSLAPSIVINQANMSTVDKGFDALKSIKIKDLLDIYFRASSIFARETLAGISPAEYTDMTSLATGLPVKVIEQRGLAFLEQALAEVERLIQVQSPDKSATVYDTYHVKCSQANIGFVPTGRNLAMVLPGNHPAVNVIWLTAVAMKYPVIIRPSFDDPFTPHRLVLALNTAGLPTDCIFFLPCGHAGADLMIQQCQRSVVFGSEEVVHKYQSVDKIKAYGPGQSKIVIGSDMADNIEMITEIVLQSMMLDGGRGCVNASAVIIPRNAKQLAQSVSERVKALQPLDPLDPEAEIPAVKDKKIAESMQQIIDAGVNSGARDVTASMRNNTSVAQTVHGIQFLLPTVVLCESFLHPLFGKEYPFQFITIAEVEERDLPDAVKESLAVTIISEDQDLIEKILLEPTVKKIYTGKKYTCDFDPAEPHEGFIAELLFEQKAYHPPVK